MKVHAYLEDGPLRGRMVETNPDDDLIIVRWQCWPLAFYRRTDRTTADGFPIYEFAGSPELLMAVSKSIDPAYIPRWLETPNPMLEGLTPAQAISSGQEGLIWKALERARSGDPS